MFPLPKINRRSETTLLKLFIVVAAIAAAQLPARAVDQLSAGAAAQLSAHAQSFSEFYGDQFRPNPDAAPAPQAPLAQDAIHRWNQAAIDATGLDHAPTNSGGPHIFGEQLGPGRASRAMAIVHIAMADVVSAVSHRFTSFTGVTKLPTPISSEIAISQAGHDALVALYPSQTAKFDDFLASDLQRFSATKTERANGKAFGAKVAAAILSRRAGDGVQVPEPTVGSGHPTSDLAGHWRQDPISQSPIALGAHWGECTTFVIDSEASFRTPAPPALTSPEYTAAFNEAKNFGGDGVHTPTQRTPEQTFISGFWAYDGTPSLCAPPRLYNQITVQLARQRGIDNVDLARLLALVNVALADTGYAAWESKFYWDFWRPVTGVREADPGTGPTGSGDGNPDTIGDTSFMPFGAPASNLTGPNFTPPFPAYPSGHAAFGGALFEVLRAFFGTDQIPFTFVSDEFNGVTRDNAGNVRPYMPRYFSTLSQAEEENGQSRIYLGIHWAFDKTEGIAQGRRVADYVFPRIYQPIP